MDVGVPPETFVAIYQTTWRFVFEGSVLMFIVTAETTAHIIPVIM
jgi:hypothetical protein